MHNCTEDVLGLVVGDPKGGLNDAEVQIAQRHASFHRDVEKANQIVMETREELIVGGCDEEVVSRDADEHGVGVATVDEESWFWEAVREPKLFKELLE